MIKTLLKYLLSISWKYPLGTRLKYHLKKLNFTYKKLGWSIKVYETESNLLNKREWKEKFFFNWSKIDGTISGIADPFLVAYKDKLYVFFEAIKKGKGELWVADYSNKKLESPTCILSKNTHLSYPNVFTNNGAFYMIPESYQEEKVSLYISKKFPYTWELDKILQEGKKLVDTNVIELEGIYYWFSYDLEIEKSRLFYSKSISSKWEEHPQSPFSSNRNAGNIIEYNNKLLRPVQVSKNTYGEGVTLKEITILNKLQFKEEICIGNFLKKENGFTLDGSHHISIASFKAKTYIAIDGKNNNFYSIV